MLQKILMRRHTRRHLHKMCSEFILYDFIVDFSILTIKLKRKFDLLRREQRSNNFLSFEEVLQYPRKEEIDSFPF